MPLERRVLEKVFLVTVKIYSKFEHFITNKVQLSPPYFLLECASLVISYVPLLESDRQGKWLNSHPCPCSSTLEKGKRLNLSHLCLFSNLIDKGGSSTPTYALV